MRGKKSTPKQNFYFTILSELKKTTNLSKIKEKLSLSKQQLNYYLRQLKKKGFVYSKGYGWWELTQKGKNPTQYGIFLEKDSIRGHAYIWNVKLPKEIEVWDKRIEILKEKGINFNLVGAFKNIPRIKVLGRKVWLCDDHLRIFDIEKSSYYGENAIESRNNSTLQLYHIVDALEKKLGILFKPFEFSVRKEHYALIKNDLAIDQNRKGIIMRIADENGEWLLIDDSLGEGGELENIGKKALSTNIPMQKWWNDMKRTDFKVTPTFLMESMNQVTANQRIFDANMMSHLEVLENIGKGLFEMRDTISELREEVKKLNDK